MRALLCEKHDCGRTDRQTDRQTETNQDRNADIHALHSNGAIPAHDFRTRQTGQDSLVWRLQCLDSTALVCGCPPEAPVLCSVAAQVAILLAAFQ